MARDHSRTNVTIWGDPDWRLLPPAAQHLYFMLWTSPELTYCGTHDWRPARLTGLTYGWDREHIETISDCLRARHFLVIDEDTEETLIRSWIRFDGLLKQPRMAVSCVSAYSAVSSPVIRQVLVHELQKEQKRLPNLSCWKDSRVAEVLSHPAVSAKDLPTPDDPFGPDVRDRFAPGLALGLPQTPGRVSTRVSTPPTPAPTPTPTPTKTLKTTAPRERGARIPDPFDITDDMRSWAAEHVPGLNLDDATTEFVDYWRGVPGAKGVKLDWAATWRNRMREVHKRNLNGGRRSPQTVTGYACAEDRLFAEGAAKARELQAKINAERARDAS